MSLQPVSAWDLRALVVSESTYNTVPAPASAQAFELINIELGPPETGVIRPKKDRSLGRGMQTAWVEGRVAPIPWSIESSLKTRAAADTVPSTDAIYAAGGLKKTVNVGTSVVYSLVSNPIETGDAKSMSLTRTAGSPNVPNLGSVYLAETLFGAVSQQLRWEGGDKEVQLKANGVGAGKLLSGALDSVTLASGVVTTLTHTAEESYRLFAGHYYQIESEIVQVTSVGYGSTSSTIVRGALSSSAVAHTAKPMQPYIPSGISYTGNLIAEPVGSVSIGGVSFRSINWFVQLKTGMDLLPGEVGSKRIHGMKYLRYDVDIGMRLVLHGDDVSLLGKVTQRPTVAATIVQGTGAGGIITFSAPYCEVKAFPVPMTNSNDVAYVDVGLRVRDSVGNDALTITHT